MPISRPTIAASSAPLVSAMIRIQVSGMPEPLSAEAITVPVKAPMLMNPACPRESSPSTPTVRFSDSAMMT